MRKLILCFFLCFVCSSLDAKTMMLEIASSNRPARIYDIRIASFANFFGDSLFTQDDGKTFFFYESLDSKRLYVVDSNNPLDFYVYQLPRIKKLPWLNPQKYMDSRAKIYEEQKGKSTCLTKRVAIDSLIKQLIDLHLDRHSTIEEFVEWGDEGGPNYYGGRNVGNLVLGYSVANGKKRYFYHGQLDSLAFANLRQKVDLKDSLKKYDHELLKWNYEIFIVLEKLESRITFEDCI